MYEAFFGLQSKPFELVPNPRFLFQSQSHRKALSYLRYGIEERAGFILLTGEVGSGKTTIIRDLVSRLGSGIRLALIFNTRVSPEQLLAMINEEFGLDVEGKDKVALLRELNDFLIAEHVRGGLPIVIIDEAQNLSAEALEEVRLLSNLEAASFKLLQIILVGQPELKGIIAQESLRQLRQRIGINCHIEPLSRDEAKDYVYHRLETAGNREAVNFYPGTFDSLYNFSQGIPRLINVFCDFLLLAAFVEETRDLTLELVEEVLGDVAWETAPNHPAEQFPFATDQNLLEELVARFARLEAGLARLEAATGDRQRLAERIASFEASLKSLAEQQASAAAQLDRTLKGITGRFAQLQSTAERAGLEPDARKGLLARLFS